LKGRDLELVKVKLSGERYQEVDKTKQAMEINGEGIGEVKNFNYLGYFVLTKGQGLCGGELCFMVRSVGRTKE